MRYGLWVHQAGEVGPVVRGGIVELGTVCGHTRPGRLGPSLGEVL